jgi:hypothetical protein
MNKNVAVVELANCPTRFESFNQKAEELRLVYKFILELSEQIECYEIYFISKQQTLH